MSGCERERHSLLMIRSFVDDSSDGNVYLLGGWVADYSEWERFSDDWAQALREEPGIDYFRHHEAKAAIPEGQFKDWPESDVNTKMTKLVDVICAHEMYGIVSG